MCLWILGMHSVQTTPRCEDPKSLSQGNALRVALGWPPKRNYLSLMEISLMMGAALDRMFKWFGLIVRRTT